MLKIVSSNQFKKDLKLAIKRKLNIKLLDNIVSNLANNKKLDEKYKDHPLKGEYASFRECHIEPDWLLIYRKNDKNLELFLLRTGTHSDLFE